MIDKTKDPDVAPTTSGSKTKHIDIPSIPDYDKIDKGVKSFIERYDIDPTEEELVVSILRDGVWRDSIYHPDFFKNLKKSTGDDINSYPDVYLSTGTFQKGSMYTEGGITKGRTGTNLNRILGIPLDADSVQYLAYIEGVSLKDRTKRKELVERIHNMSNGDLDKMLRDDFLSLIKSNLDRAKIPYSEIRTSGFGFYVLIDINPKDQRKIEEIRNVHREFVELINKLAGFELFDNAVKDAGTRCIRPENSYNFKNPAMPRLVKVIERCD